MHMLAALLIFSITAAQACTDGDKVRDKIDCASYLLCTNNTQSSVTCGSGLYFNPSNKTCEASLPENEICIEDGNYTTKGTIKKQGDLPLYRVGTGEKIVIWNYAIGGINMGRTKLLCDLVASAGYQVILPDYFRGKGLNFRDRPTAKYMAEFMYNESQWSNLKKDLDDIIMPYAVANGGKKFYTVGTCWGSYISVRLGGYTYKGTTTFDGGVSMHPSHPSVIGNNSNERVIMEAIKSPQLFLNSAKEIDGNTGMCGLDKEVLGNMLTIYDFADMKHGFTVTGLTSDANANRDTKKALRLLVDFLDAPTNETRMIKRETCATSKPAATPASEAAVMGGQTVLLTVLMLASALALKY